MVRKIICLIFLLAFCSTSFGLSDNEIKYKWNKLDLVTKYKSGVIATWSEYKGYSAIETGVGYGTLKVKPESSKDIEDWYVTKGGDQVSEVEYLKTVGEDKKAAEIESDLAWRSPGQIISATLALGGLIYATYAAYTYSTNKLNQMDGWAVCLSGMLINSIVRPPKHYLRYNDVGYKIDTYNLNLQKELGL